jgi:hypothetical protein
MSKRILTRRTLATLAVAAVAAVGSVAGTSLAQDAGTSPATSTASTASATPGGILAGVGDALTRLVADGTISQSQSAAVQRQANAGSIDPKQLVQDGTLTDAQMRAVADAIDHIKQAAG